MNSLSPILLIEDDDNDVVFIRRALSKAGVTNRLEVVNDGDAAIEYLLAKGIYSDRFKYPIPMCILTDLKMPKKGGLDLLRWLQEHKDCNVIPTVVLTSSSQPQDIRLAYELGANCYFVKPNDPTELQRLLKTIVDFWNFAAVPPIEHC